MGWNPEAEMLSTIQHLPATGMPKTRCTASGGVEYQPLTDINHLHSVPLSVKDITGNLHSAEIGNGPHSLYEMWGGSHSGNYED
jgi:hypothetical protein